MSGASALAVYLGQLGYFVDVYIVNSTVEGNVGDFGGVVIAHYNSIRNSKTHIYGTTVVNNRATQSGLGGGLLIGFIMYYDFLNSFPDYPNDVFETYSVPRQLMGQPVSSTTHYDVPKNLLSRRDEAPPNSRAGKLHRSNSSPSHGIYSVPRSTLAGQSHVQTTGPPVARKPSKQRKLVPSRSFDLSPVVETSPERNPHPNDVLYDVPPLDPDVLADREAKTVALHNTDGSKQPSKFEQELKTVRLHKTHRQKKAETLPVSKKKKVPPPTKNKPRKSESKEHRR